MFWNRGICFVHLNVNILLPILEERHCLLHLTNTSAIGVGETKLDVSVLNSEVTIEGVWFSKTSTSKKVGCVTSFIKYPDAYSHKTNTEILFTEIYLPKWRPFIVGVTLGVIYYRKSRLF